MSPNPTWTRRNFVSTLGLTGAAAALAPHLSASVASATTPTKSASFLAFVGSEQNHIQTFAVEDNKWRRVPQTTAAVAPRALITHPTLPILYVAHSVDTHKNLPRGSVSAYAIKANGQHTLLSHEPLALSSTNPNHLAISPDGRTLLAISPSGGSYNFFSLAGDGRIQPTPYPLKQTGSGPDPLQSTASPHSAVFAPSGAAYATDLGADRLNHIAFDNGIPAIASRLSFDPGSGPAHLAIHPSGKFLVVASVLRPGLRVIPIDSATGQVETPLSHLAIEARTLGPISFSPNGGRLQGIIVARAGHDTLSTFRFSSATGELKLIGNKTQPSTLVPTQWTLARNLDRSAISIASMPIPRA